MNRNVLLISKDWLFRRALSLELVANRFHVREFDHIPDRVSDLIEKTGVLLFDTDSMDITSIRDYYSDYTGDLLVILFGRTFAGQMEEADRIVKTDRVILIHRPFSVENLLKLMEANVSDNERAPQTGSDSFLNKSSADELVYNAHSDTFFFRGDPIKLTNTESAVLRLLYENRGSVVQRKVIHDTVFGESEDKKSNVTDVYIRYLRAKIDQKYDVRLIRSVRGIGYAIYDF